jgi:hypothetical protein
MTLNEKRNLKKFSKAIKDTCEEALAANTNTTKGRDDVQSLLRSIFNTTNLIDGIVKYAKAGE